MKRITLDTNEYVSALGGGGRALRLLHMAIDGDVEIAVSAEILTETIRVLREKFLWRPYDLHEARLRLQRICRLVEPTRRISVLADEPDNRILECANAAGSEYIITEDKVMLKLQEYGGARIVSAAGFFELCLKR